MVPLASPPAAGDTAPARASSSGRGQKLAGRGALSKAEGWQDLRQVLKGLVVTQ